ncbi:hypothetical protein ACN28C_08630 [Plantactinospora sp. WMMC1484]|uniref:hypothetical protein n=1 Tax=Plantactinospora sp. WMMC1484 TaxID=3404122 RepID=UPI003BF5712C
MTGFRRPPVTAKTVLRGAARGGVAAMAMSGLRQATTGLGLVRQTPPESVLAHTAPRLFQRVPVERRRAVIELLHWSYGAGGGLLFGLLPRPLRRRSWIGPLYGFAFWTVFEAALAPALGIDKHREGVRQRAALLVDHLLYGVVVASSPWPHAD